MRVCARWPSHHARTSVVERSDRSRHAANEAPEDPEEEAPIPGVFVFEEEPDAANEGEGVALSFLSSGYWRSIWNERASRRSSRAHTAHECFCSNPRAKSDSTAVRGAFSFFSFSFPFPASVSVLEGPSGFCLASTMASLWSCSRRNLWNAWILRGLLWSSLVSSSSLPSVSPSAAASRTCRSVRKKLSGCAAADERCATPRPAVGGAPHVRQKRQLARQAKLALARVPPSAPTRGGRGT